jgi:hypothetical protein
VIAESLAWLSAEGFIELSGLASDFEWKTAQAYRCRYNVFAV